MSGRHFFHFADVLPQTLALNLPSWADATVATFYVGVASASAFSFWARPALKRAGPWGQTILFQSPTQVISVRFFAVAVLAGILILLGLSGIMRTTAMWNTSSISLVTGFLSLAALGGGAGLFELLVLAVLTRISYRGNGAVALALGIVAAAAALALFLLTLGGLRFLGWVLSIVTGLALALWLVRGVENPEERQPI